MVCLPRLHRRSPALLAGALSLLLATSTPLLAQTVAPTDTPTPTPPLTATTTPTAGATATAEPRATATVTPEPVAPAPVVPHDARYFAETGFRIDNDALWGYFQARGQVETFGFPVSRTFTFLGCTTQIFQRQVAQVCAGGQPQLINLLDPDIFPYTRVNGSTFPAPDPAIKNATPPVSDPNYAATIIDFVRANAPDTFQGQPVGFGQLFFSSVTASMAGTSDQNLLNLMDLEVWGAPISAPQADPHNANFIYQRFQRGIMHYDASTGVTHGILLADYLKAILLGPTLAPAYGATLPADLAGQAASSRFFGQYCPGQPGWLCRPGDLAATDLTNAFESDRGAGTSPSATATPLPVTATPAPTESVTPAATASPTEGTSTATATLS